MDIVAMVVAAAEAGDANSQLSVGVMYEMGDELGIPGYPSKNLDEAIKWYRKAAMQGNEDAKAALKRLNVSLMEKTDSVEDEPTSEGCYVRGCMFYGNGDYQSANIWYKKAAEKGHAKAQCCLGELYIAGIGVAQNFEEGVKWFKKAAEQGEVEAQYNLGGCYKNGRGVRQNYIEAIKWYKKAAEQGDDGAKEALRRLNVKL